MVLFHVHSTKIAIRTCLARLEHDAARSKYAAAKAKEAGSTQVALTHMRRGKLISSDGESTIRRDQSG